MHAPTTAELNQAFAIEQSHTQLRIENKVGEFPIIHLRNAHAEARISLYGAQILHYKPHDTAHDVLFLSDKAIYQSGKAIRGGAPLCWPWFGADPENQGRPAHGFARTSLWQLSTTESLNDGATRVVLRLNDSPDTLALWPYHFQLELDIIVGKTLKLSLSTHNLSDQPMTISQAIHTYFAVADIAQTEVYGLEQLHYVDKSKAGQNALRTQDGSIKVKQEVDRIYLNSPSEIEIYDQAWQRCIRIHSSGSQSTVVWNPWIEITANMIDLNDDDYQRFICVETTNVADDTAIIAPNASHRLTTEYTVEALS